MSSGSGAGAATGSATATGGLGLGCHVLMVCATTRRASGCAYPYLRPRPCSQPCLLCRSSAPPVDVAAPPSAGPWTCLPPMTALKRSILRPGRVPRTSAIFRTSALDRFFAIQDLVVAPDVGPAHDGVLASSNSDRHSTAGFASANFANSSKTNARRGGGRRGAVAYDEFLRWGTPLIMAAAAAGARVQRLAAAGVGCSDCALAGVKSALVTVGDVAAAGPWSTSGSVRVADAGGNDECGSLRRRPS